MWARAYDIGGSFNVSLFAEWIDWVYYRISFPLRDSFLWSLIQSYSHTYAFASFLEALPRYQLTCSSFTQPLITLNFFSFFCIIMLQILFIYHLNILRTKFLWNSNHFSHVILCWKLTSYPNYSIEVSSICQLIGPKIYFVTYAHKSFIQSKLICHSIIECKSNYFFLPLLHHSTADSSYWDFAFHSPKWEKKRVEKCMNTSNGQR